MAPLSFRSLGRDDLPLLHEWLQRPHVHAWWSDHETLEEVVEHYLPAIDGDDPTDHFLVLADGRPVAFIETYLIADYPEWAELIGAAEGAAGVDLLIGDEELTGKGLGTRMLAQFLDEIVFARPGTTHCLADPDVRNEASIRLFAKLGFRVVREFVDPADEQLHALVRLDRPR